ncbi:hypothetical protein Pmani_005942 [Petrolisthes manimaculis]|uniref:Uncharacterized protein n=1 Tax=Petrolisthes manimaculis TaxID=1843537 RepID=A0AAE1QAQ7_9EUCA|nr:hypothetical protein Pmani_005942 [Petrolisthes manimaculis]
MPDLVLCNSQIFNPHAAQEAGLDQELKTYLAAVLNGPNSVTEGFAKDVGRQEALDTRFHQLLSDENTFDGQLYSLLRNVSWRCDDWVLRCYIPELKEALSGKDCCRKVFKPCVTTQGLCYTAPLTSLLRQEMEGEYRGVFLLLQVPREIPQDDLDWSMLNEKVMTSTGLQVAVKNNVTSASAAMLSQPFPITQATKMNNELATRGVWPWSVAQCTPPSASPTRLLTASGNCIFHAFYSDLLLQHNCTLPSAPPVIRDQYRMCTMREMLQHTDQQHTLGSTSCATLCHEEKYDASMVSSPLKSNLHALMPPHHFLLNNTNQPRFDLATLTVFYPRIIYTEIIQSKPNLFDWISSLGGQVGLCIGASVITVLELIMFILWLIFVCVKGVFRSLLQ